MIKRIFTETLLTEGTNIPCEGIFWVINGKLIALKDPIDTIHGIGTDLTHMDVWKSIKQNYKVSNRPVKYDYFPRGRVMILPIYDNDRNLKYYDCTVYIDKCIDNNKIRDYIEDEFRLYLKTCRVTYEGQLGLDGSHYTCHNCR